MRDIQKRNLSNDVFVDFPVEISMLLEPDMIFDQRNFGDVKEILENLLETETRNKKE